jgi:hypothetical protein
MRHNCIYREPRRGTGFRPVLREAVRSIVFAELDSNGLPVRSVRPHQSLSRSESRAKRRPNSSNAVVAPWWVLADTTRRSKMCQFRHTVGHRMPAKVPLQRPPMSKGLPQAPSAPHVSEGSLPDRRTPAPTPRCRLPRTWDSVPVEMADSFDHPLNGSMRFISPITTRPRLRITSVVIPAKSSSSDSILPCRPSRRVHQIMSRSCTRARRRGGTTGVLD